MTTMMHVDGFKDLFKSDEAFASFAAALTAHADQNSLLAVGDRVVGQLQSRRARVVEYLERPGVLEKIARSLDDPIEALED